MTDPVLSYPPDPTSPPSAGDPRDGATLELFGHDLRGALSDVVGGLRLISAAGLDPLTRAQIERVQVTAEGLARLLEQGLAVMLGQTPAQQTQVVNLRRFLSDLDLRWSGRAAEAGVAFAMQVSPDLPISLLVDHVALDRVMSNLLGNAFKYGGRGRVDCDLSLRADGGLRITVRDDGPGFPAAVFDPARPFQNRPPKGMAEPGSGLGLRIVANLTRLMGGKLTIRNLVPNGAQAQVDLPPSASATEDSDLVAVGPFLQARRVLIADDNPTSQAIAARMVVTLGGDVVVVADGVEAIRRLQRESFDLLIVDVEMPQLSGLEVIHRLRRMTGTVAQMPVVAMTAHGMPADRKALLAAGADDVLIKPLLSPVGFAALLRGVLKLAACADPLPVAAKAAPTVPVHGLQQDRLRRLLEMAGPDVSRELLDRLVSDLDGVHRGLRHAGDAPDWPAIRHQSHILIAMAGTVGAIQVQTEAEELNQIGNRTDATGLAGLLPIILRHLDSLIAEVRQVRAAYLAPSA